MGYKAWSVIAADSGRKRNPPSAALKSLMMDVTTVCLLDIAESRYVFPTTLHTHTRSFLPTAMSIPIPRWPPRQRTCSLTFLVNSSRPEQLVTHGSDWAGASGGGARRFDEGGDTDMATDERYSPFRFSLAIGDRERAYTDVGCGYPTRACDGTLAHQRQG